MRALTAQQTAIVATGARSTFGKVEIYANGAWQNMGALDGDDWQESIEWGEGTGQHVSTLGATFVKQRDQRSLAPLQLNSKLNAGGAIVALSAPVRAYVAITPYLVQPVAADWIHIFTGVIDTHDSGGSKVAIQCRDQGALLADTFIETQQIYGSEAGTAAETVMQEILDTEFGTNVIILYSPNGTLGTPWDANDSPGFLLTEYKQSKKQVLPALNDIALQIGWQVRYRWHANTSEFQLQFYEPGRETPAIGILYMYGQPVAAETFTINVTTLTAVAGAPGANQFQIGATTADTVANLIGAVRGGAENVNVACYEGAPGPGYIYFEWRVPGTAGNGITLTEALTNTSGLGATLGDSVPGTSPAVLRTFPYGRDGYHAVKELAQSRVDIRNVIKVIYPDAATGTRVQVTRDDPDSIAVHGRRTMEITEDASSQIDTYGEANSMARTALLDLLEPDAAIATPMALFPWVEHGDRYAFEANAEDMSSDLTAAVREFRHVVRGGKGTTTLKAAGKPSIGAQRWLVTEGRPGVAPAQDLYSDAAAAGVTIEPLIGGVAITYDDPRTQEPPIEDWSTSRCHISTTLDFVPAGANLVGIGRQTRFEITGLVYGQTYYAKIVVVDNKGNESVTSTQVVEATQRVGPHHANNESEFSSINPNPNFGILTLPEATNPPDHWAVGAGAWGAGAGEWYTDAVTQLSGGVALRLASVATSGSTVISEFDSDFVLLPGGRLFKLAFAWRHNGAYGNKVPMTFTLDLFDDAKSSVGTIQMKDDTGGYQTALPPSFAANTWVLDQGWFLPYTTARYCKIRIRVQHSTGILGAQLGVPTLYFDHLRLTRAVVRLLFDAGVSSRTIAPATWVADWLEGSTTRDNAVGFTSGLAVGPTDGYYTFAYDTYARVRGAGGLSVTNVGKFAQMRLLKNGGVLSTGEPHTVSAALPSYSVECTDFFLAGDVLKLEHYHNDTVSRTIQGAATVLSVEEIADAP